jgi:hypothetical protein
LSGNATSPWNSLLYLTDHSDFVGVLTGGKGGTGVSNAGHTITLGGSLVTSGATTIGSSTHTVTLSTGANTSVTLPASGTLSANNYSALIAGTTAMAFGTNNCVTVTPTATATYTSTVPVAGQRATIIFLTSGTTSYTITFGTGFKANTLATGTTTGKYWTVNFISDGVQLVETGRSGPI